MAELVIQRSERATQTEQGGSPRVLAFELQSGGHHPSYIRNFALQWAERLLPAKIDFVVTCQFFDRHHDVVDLIGDLAPDHIRIHCLSESENKSVNPGALREFHGWKLFCD